MVKSEADPDTLRYAERIVKNLLWVRGGWKIYFGGPQQTGEYIHRCCSPQLKNGNPRVQKETGLNRSSARFFRLFRPRLWLRRDRAGTK
jgi:hypothetical protein